MHGPYGVGVWSTFKQWTFGKKETLEGEGSHLQAITWASLVVPEYLRNRYLGILVLILSLIDLRTSDPTLIKGSREL